jgi:hypothetical protein
VTRAAQLCPCPECTRAAQRFPEDPPQLPIPVSIYPSTPTQRVLPLRQPETVR